MASGPNAGAGKAKIISADKDAREVGFLGELVWWSMNNVAPTAEQLERALLESRFNPKEVAETFMPKPLDKRQAFTRAIASITNLLKAKDDATSGRTFIIKKVEDTVDHTAFAIMQAKHKATTQDTKTDQLQLLTMKKTDDSWTNTTDLMLAEFREAFEYAMLHYRDDHIRKIVLDALSMWEAIPVRESGGVYFIPREVVGDPTTGAMMSSAPMLRAVQDFVQHPYNGTCVFTRLAIADTEQTRASMSQTYQTNILDEIRKIREEVSAAVAATKGTLSSRASSSKVLALDNLKQQSQMYALILNSEFKALNKAIAECDAEIKKAMGVTA